MDTDPSNTSILSSYADYLKQHHISFDDHWGFIRVDLTEEDSVFVNPDSDGVMIGAWVGVCSSDASLTEVNAAFAAVFPSYTLTEVADETGIQVRFLLSCPFRSAADLHQQVLQMDADVHRAAALAGKLLPDDFMR